MRAALRGRESIDEHAVCRLPATLGVEQNQPYAVTGLLGHGDQAVTRLGRVAGLQAMTPSRRPSS